MALAQWTGAVCIDHVSLGKKEQCRLMVSSSGLSVKELQVSFVRQTAQK